jgi:hypothetical protein
VAGEDALDEAASLDGEVDPAPLLDQGGADNLDSMWRETSPRRTALSFDR